MSKFEEKTNTVTGGQEDTEEKKELLIKESKTSI